ncbi:hypothetical protein TrRE_jg10815 [Triparma retinervis]|uniref:Uncharacterized protein n=1 Tax=Triparma retinervis TaxID=2557542 RepID=A0A9W7G0E9_9STRA|nr:hypothetical protein TrRE_jg10815 [Triparma retinervis]
MSLLFPARRLGKWGKEEESYAARLIQMFELGCVPDCENGTTLRAFLAVQLYCAPMRISKKVSSGVLGRGFRRHESATKPPRIRHKATTEPSRSHHEATPNRLVFRP